MRREGPKKGGPVRLCAFLHGAPFISSGPKRGGPSLQQEGPRLGWAILEGGPLS